MFPNKFFIPTSDDIQPSNISELDNIITYATEIKTKLTPNYHFGKPLTIKDKYKYQSQLKSISKQLKHIYHQLNGDTIPIHMINDINTKHISKDDFIFPKEIDTTYDFFNNNNEIKIQFDSPLNDHDSARHYPNIGIGILSIKNFKNTHLRDF